jgi:hypothetical protein
LASTHFFVFERLTLVLNEGGWPSWKILGGGRSLQHLLVVAGEQAQRVTYRGDRAGFWLNWNGLDIAGASVERGGWSCYTAHWGVVDLGQCPRRCSLPRRINQQDGNNDPCRRVRESRSQGVAVGQWGAGDRLTGGKQSSVIKEGCAQRVPGAGVSSTRLMMMRVAMWLPVVQGCGQPVNADVRAAHCSSHGPDAAAMATQ